MMELVRESPHTGIFGRKPVQGLSESPKGSAMNKATQHRPATNQHGHLLITTNVQHDGIAFHVTAGADRVDELTKAFTNRAQAAAYYRHIAQAAEQGKRIHQIVAEVQALEEAQNAATGRTAEQIREAITADIDAHRAEAVIPTHNQTVTAVADIMAGTARTGGWYGARKAAQQATHRAVEPTRTQVHRKPLTPVEQDLIRHARTDADGNLVVTTRPGQSWLVLRAMWRRIGGERTYKPGTRKIASLTLSPRGLDVADQNEEIAA